MSVRRWNVYEVGGGGYFRIEWRDEPNGSYVSATDYDALTARVAELEAKLGQAQHAYTVTAMELDRYKNPGQTIRLSAADGGCQSKETK